MSEESLKPWERYANTDGRNPFKPLLEYASKEVEVEKQHRNQMPVAIVPDLADNQKALVKLLKTGNYELTLCTNGFALWRKDIKWSQGRTANNAISQEDIDALIRCGYLIEKDFGAVDINYWGEMPMIEDPPEGYVWKTDIETAYKEPSWTEHASSRGSDSHV